MGNSWQYTRWWSRLSSPVAAKDSDYVPIEGEVLRVYSKYISLIQYKQVTAYSLIKVQQKQDKFQSMDKQMVRAIRNQQTEVTGVQSGKLIMCFAQVKWVRLVG